MRSYVIHYYYKNRVHTSVTKPCTPKQAVASFHQELNSLNTFMLIKVVPAK